MSRATLTRLAVGAALTTALFLGGILGHTWP